MSDKRPALGKGLSALIPDAPAPVQRPAPLDIDIDLLQPNDVQPRQALDQDRLAELAASITAHGIIQPIVVRRLDAGRFQIIAGERRWRAAQRAGLQRVPIVVKDVSSEEAQRRLELALIENLQREDLNPIEEAQAYHRLAHDHGLSHDTIAHQVGKDRSSIANTLRLLKLPDEIRAEVSSGTLSMGHARALVGLMNSTDQLRISREIIARQLSVRETEALVKRLTSPGVAVRARGRAQTATKKDVHTRAAEEQLRLALGTAVTITRRGKRGVLEIAFTSEDELQRLYEQLTGR